MKTRKEPIIICGFPGVGKTVCARNCNTVSDFDSSQFHYKSDGNGGFISVAEVEWIRNYVDAIQELRKNSDVDYILVSCHKKLREKLHDKRIPFIVVAPERGLRNEYMKRYFRRGDSVEFMEKVGKNWATWLTEIGEEPEVKIYLESNEYLYSLMPIIPNYDETLNMFKEYLNR